jgi:hypothetical protein
MYGLLTGGRCSGHCDLIATVLEIGATGEIRDSARLRQRRSLADQDMLSGRVDIPRATLQRRSRQHRVGFRQRQATVDDPGTRRLYPRGGLQAPGRIGLAVKDA